MSLFAFSVVLFVDSTTFFGDIVSEQRRVWEEWMKCGSHGTCADPSFAQGKRSCVGLVRQAWCVHLLRFDLHVIMDVWCSHRSREGCGRHFCSVGLCWFHDVIWSLIHRVT